MCFGRKHSADNDGENFAPRPVGNPNYQSGGYDTKPIYHYPQHQVPLQPTTAHYAPPAGPPPSWVPNPIQPVGYSGTGHSWIGPPAGPPPEEKPKEPWEIIPDSSLLPPPPNIFSAYDRSPANNASEDEYEAGKAWCLAYPLLPPLRDIDPFMSAALKVYDLNLLQPLIPGWPGVLERIDRGVWQVKCRNIRDSTLIAYPPLYTTTLHAPLTPSNPRPTHTIYYEVALTKPPTSLDTVIALGFAALPYPSFRLPGWHRGSLAIHSDDGHRYINDAWGGKEFTSPFFTMSSRPGERCGIGMTFSRPQGKGTQIEVDVFFTKDGKKVGGWDVNEESDAKTDLGVEGLQGHHDLYCAVGVCGGVEFQIVMEPGKWLFTPGDFIAEKGSEEV